MRRFSAPSVADATEDRDITRRRGIRGSGTTARRVGALGARPERVAADAPNRE